MSTNANTLARNLFITLPIDADWTTDHNGNEIITLADSMIAIGDDEDGGLTWTRYTGNSFLRMQLGAGFQQQQMEAQLYETAAAAQSMLKPDPGQPAE